MRYEIIETKKKFNKSDIYCEYYQKLFAPIIDLDYKTPICISNDIFIKFYLKKNSFIDRIRNGLGNNEKVIALLKEELEKIYTTEDNGYILSDNFEQLAYFCDDDSELDDKINEIGIQIIKEAYFSCPYYNFYRSIRLVDDKMIIRSHYQCFINLLNKEDIQLGNCDKLNIMDIEKIIYNFLLENKEYLSLSELSSNIIDLLMIIERKYGKINNIYEVRKEYIEEINDMFSLRTLLIETEKKIITINIGYID